MKKQINITGKINSFGTQSIDSAEVFFNSHIESCSCSGSYSYSAMLEMEQIKEVLILTIYQNLLNRNI